MLLEITNITNSCHMRTRETLESRRTQGLASTWETVVTVPIALEALSGNLLGKAESGAQGRLTPRSRGAAGRGIPPHLVRAPAAFRAADPRAGQQGSQGASSLGQKRGAGLRRGHRDPARAGAPGPSAAGNGKWRHTRSYVLQAPRVWIRTRGVRRPQERPK